MKKSKKICDFKKYVILITLLLPIYNVLAMEITTNITEITVYTSNTDNIYFNIYNNETEPLYNIHLSSSNSDLTFLNNDFNISVNETISIKGVLDTSTKYSNSTTISMIFFRKSPIVLTPENKNVTINNINYQPNEIELIKDASILWTNLDTIKHTVTSSLFDVDLEQAQTFSFLFNTIGIYPYYDKHTMYTGNIVVKDINGNDLIHDPRDDKLFYININSILVETELFLNFVDITNFSIEYNSQIDSVLSISNNGSLASLKTKLTSIPNWLTFGKNDFVVESGKTSFISYTISPTILNVNDTNKNYNIIITMSSDNSLVKYYNISVYIPLATNLSLNSSISKLFNQTLSDDFLIALFNTICTAHPDYTYCKQKIVEKIIYQSPPVPYNFTYDQVDNLMRKYEGISILIERGYKDNKKLVDSIKSDTELTRNASLNTEIKVSSLQDDTNFNKKEIGQYKNLMIFVILIIIFSLLIYIGIRSWKKNIDYKMQYHT